jgi:hypothetical protein
MFLIIQSLFFLFQVVSLVAMMALSVLAMPVYEEHQQIEEHHYVSTQTQHNTTPPVMVHNSVSLKPVSHLSNIIISLITCPLHTLLPPLYGEPIYLLQLLIHDSG